jgi:F-box protein, helicase, 18
MQLTDEQLKIINAEGNIKINAVAGSGKTTTIIAYAKSKPTSSKILYIAFNKTVKEEAIRKFAKNNLTNVTVETAHSLAFKYIVRGRKYEIAKRDYTPLDIVKILSIPKYVDKHAEFVIANHVKKYVSLFCNSNVRFVQDVNYLGTISNDNALAFAHEHTNAIILYTRQLLAKMDKAAIAITHDFYLKKFQLSNQQLPFDYILFDEGQDASNAMLDIFMQQNAIKVIVGDTHQQIYGWRYAVNSLEQVDYTTHHLSKSFRFKNEIALIAKQVIGMKEIIRTDHKIILTGVGNYSDKLTNAIIGRTNIGLLKKAIDYVVDNQKAKHIYFEGNFNTYTYADDGASLYDILNLYTGKRLLIRDALIKSMKNMEELEEYIEKTEDKELGMMLEIVEEYEENIYDILKEIKEKHVASHEREKAEVIFSTVHRCKGMEYDTVELAEDFVNKTTLNKLSDDDLKNSLIINRWNEEINLLYVAITRAKVVLRIPESLIPNYIADSSSIKILKVIEDKIMVRETSNKSQAIYTHIAKKGKVTAPPSYMDRMKEKHTGAYQPWTEMLDKELIKQYKKGKTITEIAATFDRTKGAILSRLKKLGEA